jgi:hypothetical protein
MTVIHTLWLPILLASVFVFLVSSILHMAMSWWHRSDYKKIPQEDAVMDTLRPFGIPPGDYMVPSCSGPSEMKSTEFCEKLKKGPVMMVTVVPSGPINMGKSLGLWFLYLIAVNFITGYVACHALWGWAGYARVFKIAGVTAFLGYSAALWQMSIWYQRSCLTTLKSTIDGVIYAGVTAATFGWLWPR